MTKHAAPALDSVDKLRQFVRRMLCEHDRLDIEQAVMRESSIVRASRPCGTLFQIRGPRLLRTYAIWAADENRLLFYESTGQRFADIKLLNSPGLDSCAAA